MISDQPEHDRQTSQKTQVKPGVMHSLWENDVDVPTVVVALALLARSITT